MKKLWLLILTLYFSCINCYSQDNTVALSHIPQSGKATTDFVPTGYDIKATASMDLNNDNLQDVVLLLRDRREDTAQPGSDIRGANRLVLVLLKTTDGYKLAVKSGEIVMCKDCGGVFGDPFSSIGVANGAVVIVHYGGSSEKWSATRRFKYRDGDFYLAGKTDAAFFGNDFCQKQNQPSYTSTDINLLTGDREVEELTKDCKQTKKKDKIKKEPLIKMADYKNDF
jgi:hypothetical protein